MIVAGLVEVTVIDMGTGRAAKVKAAGDTSTRDVITKAYEEMGEPGRKSDRYFDDRGNALDGDLGKPASTLSHDQGGTATIEIRHPTGGGEARRILGGEGH